MASRLKDPVDLDSTPEGFTKEDVSKWYHVDVPPGMVTYIIVVIIDSIRILVPILFTGGPAGFSGQAQRLDDCVRGCRLVVARYRRQSGHYFHNFVSIWILHNPHLYRLYRGPGKEI